MVCFRWLLLYEVNGFLVLLLLNLGMVVGILFIIVIECNFVWYFLIEEWWLVDVLGFLSRIDMFNLESIGVMFEIFKIYR